MSLSWNFLTKPFIGLRYREVMAGTMVGMYFFQYYIDYNSQGDDKEFVMTRIWCHDESNIAWREKLNETDDGVRRVKLIKFSNEIKAARAQKERE